jgi:hypothetical protein
VEFRPFFSIWLTTFQKKKDRMARRKRGEEVFSDEDD